MVSKMNTVTYILLQLKKIFEGGAQQTPALDECAINLSAELESGVIGPDSVLALKKEGKLHSSDR